jgi:hypothetical protein
MHFTYSFILILILSALIVVSRLIFLRKRNIPVELFTEALRNENSGQFEAAVINYENALNEEKKSRFHSNNLKHKITEKLKILHTTIEYNNSYHISR